MLSWVVSAACFVAWLRLFRAQADQSHEKPPSAGASKRSRPPGALALGKPAKRLRKAGLHGNMEKQEADGTEAETVQNVTVAEKFYGKGLIAAKEGLHDEALESFRTGAALGSVSCMIELAVCLAGAQGCPQDSNAALALVKRAQELLCTGSSLDIGADIARVHHNLGLSACTKEEVVQWLQKAAEYGQAGAQYDLGQFTEIVVENLEEAVAWYRKAANQGHAGALVALGLCYKRGKGVEAGDLVKAAELYRKAAETGDAAAQFNLGACYEKGEGVLQNAADAAAWYEKAAAQGHVGAQYNLALCYDHGRGLAQSNAIAAVWYRKAAEKGHVNAQYNLALSYVGGMGVPLNLVESFKWFRKAAEQGDQQAIHDVGMCYESGLGVPPNAEEALVWYGKAAELGHPTARRKLEEQ